MPERNGFRESKASTAKVLQKQTAGIVERLTIVEEGMQNLSLAVQQIVGGLTQRLSTVEETLEAIAGIVGPDQIREAIAANRIKRAEANDKALKDALAKAVEEGSVTPAEVIAESSLIVGVERTADGTPIPPGRAQLYFRQIAEPFQTELLGKGVGTVIDTKPVDSTGAPVVAGTFEVLEIYEVKPPEAAADVPVAANDNATADAQASA